MAESKPTAAPSQLPPPSRDTPAATQARLAVVKSRLPRERVT